MENERSWVCEFQLTWLIKHEGKHGGKTQANSYDARSSCQHPSGGKSKGRSRLNATTREWNEKIPLKWGGEGGGGEWGGGLSDERGISFVKFLIR